MLLLCFSARYNNTFELVFYTVLKPVFESSEPVFHTVYSTIS